MHRRSTAAVLWPLVQQAHFHHLCGLHPRDVLLMVSYVRAGDEGSYVGALHAACRAELRQPDGRHAAFLREHAPLLWQLLDILGLVRDGSSGLRRTMVQDLVSWLLGVCQGAEEADALAWLRDTAARSPIADLFRRDP